MVDQEITGDMLFHLNDKALKEIGIHVFGRRRKVMKAIENLKNSCVADQAPPEFNQNNLHQMHISNIDPVTIAEEISKSNADNSSLNLSVSFPRLGNYYFLHPPQKKKKRTIRLTFFLVANTNELQHQSSINSKFNRRSFREYHTDKKNSQLSLEIQINAAAGKPINQPMTFKFVPAPIQTTPQENFTVSTFGLSPSPITSTYALETNEPLNDFYPEHEGWLFKQSDRFKSWNKRWFVLYDNKLYYFKTPNVRIVAISFFSFVQLLI